MAFDTKMRIFGAALTIPAVLLAIGAGYERGGVAGLRDLATDTLQSVGLYKKEPAGGTTNAALPASGAHNPSSALAPDEVFWLTIKDSRAAGLFEEFLKRFPNSVHAPEARAMLRTLQAAQAAARQQPRTPMEQRDHGPGMMMRSGSGG